MSYNKTYTEIKLLLNNSKRITKATMLKIARLGIKETLGDKTKHTTGANVKKKNWTCMFVKLVARLASACICGFLVFPKGKT